MRRALAALVVSLGLFALVAEALLFRDWLAALEQSELAVGSFFATWLLWVAVGAFLGRLAGRRGPGTATALAWAALLYLPAYVLQQHLVLHARDLAGALAYDVLPLDTMLGVGFLVNAPTSLATGFLFARACQVAAPAAGLPVARVWVLEALGGFAGGLLATAALALGWSTPVAFLAAAFLLTAAVAAVGLGARRASLALPVLLVPLAALVGLPSAWGRMRDHVVWDRLLPAADLAGAFTTPQGRYLHGTVDGAFTVVAGRGVLETVPDVERGHAVAALHLAEHPTARRVLVFGPDALSIALAFRELPSLEEVTWLAPDPAYGEGLAGVLPPSLRDAVAALDTPSVALRAWLRSHVARYDLVLLALPPLTTLADSLRGTRETLALASSSLRPGGVVSMRFPGGENVLGPERTWLGASALATFESVFPRTVLVPGESSWWLGSAGAAPRLTEAPAELAERFAAVPGARALYPPAALSALVPPDRVAFQTEAYRALMADEDPRVLVSTDAAPKGLAYALAFAARKAGVRGVVDRLPAWMDRGALVVAGWILLAALLRLLFLATGGRVVPSARAGARAGYDEGLLVVTAGAVGMGLATVAMILYQARFGTLGVEVGLLSALFMLGLVASGEAWRRVLLADGKEPRAALPGLVLGVVGTALLLALLLPTASRAPCALLLLLAGGCVGGFVPLAARRWERAGAPSLVTGARVEALDHVGGAVGAVVSGLLLVPLVGATPAFALFALLAAANLAPRLVPAARRHGVPVATPVERGLRAAGTAFLGVAGAALLASNVLVAGAGVPHAARFAAAARDLVGGAGTAAKERAQDDGGTARWLEVDGAAGTPTAYVLDTASWAPEVEGYAGPIALAAHVDAGGRLVDWLFVEERETPAYRERVLAARERYRGLDLFAPDPFAGVDAVTGATITDDAVRRSLQLTGRRFAREVLGRDVGGRSPRGPPGVAASVLVLLAALLAAGLVLRRRPNVLVRRVWLAAIVLLLGLHHNVQYAVSHVLALVAGEVPPAALTGAFLLVVGVPVAVVLFGNVYCGWVCPFGALQELFGDLGRKRWETDPHREASRWGRSVKYALLALVVLAFAVGRRAEVALADPLVTFFGPASPSGALTLAVLALLLALVFGRFFCRTLCPAGAFLALLGRLRLLRPLVPPVRPGRCDLGVSRHHELDCLCCDRCRAPERRS